MKQGVRLLGGCCGTTPEHIRAMKQVLATAAPVLEKERHARPAPVVVKEAPSIQKATLAEKAKKRIRRLSLSWIRQKNAEYTALFLKERRH
ncbi:hypothetical protein GCM10020331_039780 [Ectobacillus funiculus]